MPDTHAAMTVVPPEPVVFTAVTEPQQSKSQASMYVALMSLQRELDPIKKDQKNDHLRTTYADLNAVWNAIRGPLQEHGVLVIQEPIPCPRGALVTTTLVHIESGEWRSSTTYIPARKADAQAFGSAMSYARRYSLLTVLSLMTTDDDGHAATVAPPVPTTREEMGAAAPRVEQAGEAGWNAWAQGKQLQLEGCEGAAALANCWAGMQPELKKADAGIRARLTAVKEKQKQRWATVAQEGGIDPDADVPF